MASLVDGLRPIIQALEAKYGPASAWMHGPSTTRHSQPDVPCPTCLGQGWVNRAEPNPAAQVPIFRAAPCRDCLTGRESPQDEQDRLWRLSGISTAERARCTFDAFGLDVNPEMQGPAVAAAEWGMAKGLPLLTLHSAGKGMGKTHLAIAAAGLCIGRGETVRYAVVPLLLDELRATQRRYSSDEPTPRSLEMVRRRLETYPAIVLDDLGAGKATDWAEEQLYTIVNERWRQRLRTLVTTNVDPERIEERTRSRLFDWQVANVVQCEGQDYRLTGPRGRHDA